MKCRQTVEELNLRITGQGHHFAIHLIVTQQCNPFRPFLFCFPHRHPHIGIDKVSTFNSLRDIFCQRNIPTILLCQGAAFRNQRSFRPACLRRDQTQIQTGKRRSFEHRVSHVVTRVTCINQRHFVERFAGQMLLHGEKIRQQLRGMELIGQAVPYRHASVFRQCFDNLLTIAAILNTVIHATKHAGSVFNRLFMTNLAAAWAEISNASTLVICGNFERASGTGRVFFEDERDVFTSEFGFFFTAFLIGFQLRG